MKQFAISAIAALGILGACQSPTPYQPERTSQGGYSDQKIESDRWAVRFAGNTVTNRQTVETFLLYRAAELTLGEGFDYFEIVTRQTDEDALFFSTGFSSPFFYDFRGFGPHAGFGSRRFASRSFHGVGRTGTFHDPFFAGPNSFQEQVRFEATAEILMHKGHAPRQAAYFDARDVFESLRPAIVRSR